MARDDSEFDLIVVGGGPGGSTVATFVAMQGHRVLLLEKQTMPAYKIGESLLPATVHGICPMLGVSEELQNANFVKKLGGTFLWGKNPEPWTFLFAASAKMPGPTSTAYQVERMKFDSILLRNAARKGVDVRENHAVRDVVLENDRVTGVTFVDGDGVPRTARARWVVDASGHQTGLSRHVGERIYSKFFQNVALFGYFRNAGRLPPPNQGNIFSVAFEHGWFWFIPLSDTLTSVGAVISKEYAGKLKVGHEAALNEFIAACPGIQKLLAGATRITEGIYGELRVRKDYSYCHTSFWRPGLALVGDAACFIDPVFSSGVHLATYSALLAARSINTCLRGDLDEGRCFAEFELRYRREFAHFYDFLVAFYDVNKDTESYFWHARKVLNSEEAGNTPFVELVAGVGGSGERLYAGPEDYFRERDGLGDALFGESAGIYGSPGSYSTSKGRRNQFFRDLLGEVVQLQMQASLGSQRPAEKPVGGGTLVASPDCLHWSDPTATSLTSKASSGNVRSDR